MRRDIMEIEKWKNEEEKMFCSISEKICDFLDNRIDRLYLHCYKEREAISSRVFYEKNGGFYTEKEIFSLLQYEPEEQLKNFLVVFSKCNKDWNNLYKFWNDNYLCDRMEIKAVYDLRTRTINILHSFNIPKDERYYEYVTSLWLNDLRNASGQELTGIYIKEYLLKKSEFEDNQRQYKDHWQKLFSSCLGKMTAIQLACDQYVVKNQNWSVNFQEGLISFGEDAYPIQFLGSESNQTNTWLWGWENVNQFDTQLLQLVEQVRQYGEEKALAPLQKAELMLDDDIDGHTLSIVACGIQEPPVCYYRCPHANGAAFVALNDVPEDVFQPVDAWKFMNIVAQCLKTHIVDQKIFVESFLNWNQTAYTWNGMVLTAQFHQPMEIEFEIVEGKWRVKQLLLV